MRLHAKVGDNEYTQLKIYIKMKIKSLYYKNPFISSSEFQTPGQASKRSNCEPFEISGDQRVFK